MSERTNPHRLATPHTCLQCGTTFHPWQGSARKFCSVKCAGRAKSDAAWERGREHRESVDTERMDAILREAADALRERMAAAARENRERGE
ncbi:hypothetical protein [Demequina salsinemoris]|uniref:hypothetical protein n=1 Tax=Demequina salsinemoris TaxID=577470 RepID=UPI0007849D05|nr:hypothetical protein [Demequina salsinemoris]